MLLIVLKNHVEEIGLATAVLVVMLWGAINTLRGGAERSTDAKIKTGLLKPERRDQVIQSQKFLAKIGIPVVLFIYGMALFAMLALQQ